VGWELGSPVSQTDSLTCSAISDQEPGSVFSLPGLEEAKDGKGPLTIAII
jgi:hypothetical protein